METAVSNSNVDFVFDDTRIEDGVHLVCRDNEMKFILEVNVSVNIDDVINFKNISCPIDRNASRVIAHTSFQDCGTQFEETDDEFVFKNVLTVTPRVLKHALIMRNDQIPREYELECSFSKTLRTTVDTGMIQFLGSFKYY